jgi:hypothetical protein
LTPPPRRAPPRKHEGERISDYFLPDRADQIVRRGELLAILTHVENVRDSQKWYRRLWRQMQKFYIWSARAPMASDEPARKPKSKVSE